MSKDDLELLQEKLCTQKALKLSNIFLFDGLLSFSPLFNLEALRALNIFRGQEIRHARLMEQSLEIVERKPFEENAGDFKAAGERDNSIPDLSPRKFLEALIIAKMQNSLSWEILISLVERERLSNLAEEFREAYREDLNQIKLFRALSHDIAGEGFNLSLAGKS